MFHILIVDDEKIEREGIKHLIRHYSLPLHYAEAENGLKALQYIREHPVDILFTDIRMPFMDGMQLAAEAKQLDQGLQIVFYSSYGEFEYAKRAIELKAVNYLLKPLEFDEFANVMAETIQVCEHVRKEQIEESLDINLSEAGMISSARKDISEVQDMIHREYSRDLHLDEVAERVFLSPSYLSYLFKKETGMSMMKYLTKYRIQKAKQYLRGTNMKINDIGMKVGYKNSPYFCAIFKNYTGVSPVQYREGLE